MTQQLFGDSPPSDPAIRVRWSIVVQIIAYVLGLFVAYNAMNARLTTLETNRANDISRMERIESKLDRLLERPIK